jgi:arylsulfatase A-like enzyme
MMACSSESAEKGKMSATNIILISSGPQSALDYGFMSSGTAITPALDSLADGAVVFKHGYLPSQRADENRRSLLTGISPKTYNILVDSLMQEDIKRALFKTKEDMENWKRNYPDGVLSVVPTLPTVLSQSGYITNYSGDEMNYEAAGFTSNVDAKKFISTKKEKPFFLYVQLSGSNDSEIAQLINTVKQHKLLDNTWIVYTQNQGLEDAYDLTYRTPIIFHASIVITKKNMSNELISTMDVMPTLLDYLSIDLPANLEGISYKSAMQGESINPHKIMYGQNEDFQYLRTSEYYFSWNAADDTKILFELLNDPACSDNMAAYHPAKIGGFIEKLKNRMD